MTDQEMMEAYEADTNCPSKQERGLHPDFMYEMSDAQRAWLTANGFGFKKAQPYGFWIYKGKLSIEPISAAPGKVYVLTADHSEDGDGSKVVARFDRLRDALRFVAKEG